MSQLREFFLGKSEFKTAEEIIAAVRNYKDFDTEVENITTAEALLIFQTSTQQTWLVATNARLYCVLDDINKSFTRAQWAIPKDQLVANGEVTASISTHDRSIRTGLLDIGPRHNW